MRKLSTLLIIAGILIALSPIAGRMYTQYKENKMILEWLEASEEIDVSEAEADPEEAFMQLQESFNNENTEQEAGEPETQQANTSNATSGQETAGPATEQTASPNTSPAAKPKPAVKQTVLGVIVIDKIKVKYPIVEGVKEENLRVGIGHIPGTAALGQPGNSALAGHRNYTFGRFFNRLDELVEGDKIMISTKKGDYRYVVYKKLVVTPDDVSVLKGSKDDNIITLITCTPIYIASHRLILHARLESQSSDNP